LNNWDKHHKLRNHIKIIRKIILLKK
jgi:hypothetical protein